MRLFIIIASLFVFCGCKSLTASDDHFTNMSLAYDERLTPKQREVIAVARSYLDKQHWNTDGVYYKIETTIDGYKVFVVFTDGQEQGRSLYHPIRHGCVLLRKDLSFVRYVPED
jgi:hypothetical protein